MQFKIMQFKSKKCNVVNIYLFKNTGKVMVKLSNCFFLANFDDLLYLKFFEKLTETNYY